METGYFPILRELALTCDDEARKSKTMQSQKTMLLTRAVSKARPKMTIPRFGVDIFYPSLAFVAKITSLDPRALPAIQATTN
jgi:hypothetical protein